MWSDLRLVRTDLSYKTRSQSSPHHLGPFAGSIEVVHVYFWDEEFDRCPGPARVDAIL